MKSAADTRSLGRYGAPDSQPEIALLRGAVVEGGVSNVRLRWTGSGYEATSEEVIYYRPGGLLPQTLGVDEHTYVIWRPDANRYEELTGQSSLSLTPLVYFELIEDKNYATTEALARQVLADGSLDLVTDPFYVVDDINELDRGQFFGLEAYDDEDGDAVSWSGYRGFAQLLSSEYIPEEGTEEDAAAAYRIVTMEQPADFFIGTCAESLDDGVAAVTYDDSIDPSGSPFSNRRPQLGADSRVDVYDDLEKEPQAGEKWKCKWDKLAEHYVYWLKITSETRVEKGWGLIVSTIPAVTITTTGPSDGTWGSQASAVYLIDIDEAGWSLILNDEEEGITVTGLNPSKTPIRASSTEQIVAPGRYFYTDEENPDVPTHFLVDEWDMRSLPGFTTAAAQIPYHEDGDTNFKLDAEECD